MPPSDDTVRLPNEIRDFYRIERIKMLAALLREVSAEERSLVASSLRATAVVGPRSTTDRDRVAVLAALAADVDLLDAVHQVAQVFELEGIRR